MRPEYFEGVLQLRDVNDEVIAFVRSQLDKNPDIHIAKEVPLKNGVDISLSSQNFIRKLGKRLQERFGGEVKTSNRLFGTHRQTSKLLYRINVLFRLPKYGKGSIIQYKGESYQVTSVGKKVMTKSVSTGQNRLFSYKDLERSGKF